MNAMRKLHKTLLTLSPWLAERIATFAAWPVAVAAAIELFRAVFFSVKDAGVSLAAAFGALALLATLALSFARLMTQKAEEPLRGEFMRSAANLGAAMVQFVPVIILHRWAVALYGDFNQFRAAITWRSIVSGSALLIMTMYLSVALIDGVLGLSQLSRTLYRAFLYSRSLAGIDNESPNEIPAPPSPSA